MTDAISSNNILNQPVQNSGRPSLRDKYLGVSLKKLESGPYQAKLVSHEFTAPTPQQLVLNPHAQAYIKFLIQLPDRVITDNRFEAGFAVMEAQLKEQWGLLYEDIPMQELLDRMKTQEFTIWISYAQIDNRTYRNVSYLAPLVLTETASAEGAIESKDF